jgi:cytochrome c553
MKGVLGAFAAILLITAWALAQDPNHQTSSRELPIWAYPVEASGPAYTHPPADDTRVRHVPGSTVTYTTPQVHNLFSVPDWFPNEHPPMPEIVAHGRKPVMYACGYCHLPNGQGRPENASVAGLPLGYIEEQMAAFKNGERKSSEPKMISVAHMVEIAQAATPDEVMSTASYFAGLKLKPWIRVVEIENVPKTRIAGGMLVLADGGGMEPIGERVIEVPEDLERTELRDPSSGFIAYVPMGSLKRGEALVMTGDHEKTMPCTMCHGADLKGLGNVPSIAGRSPSQMIRQLIDIQTGARNGPSALPMKGVVSGLSNDDIVAITGYLASLKP